MSPVPPEQAAVVKRYYTGDHLQVQPVGPSPAFMHVSTVKKLTPLWYELSVELKADQTADRAFGWVLEMWGYSIAAASLGVRHEVLGSFQLEGGAGISAKNAIKNGYFIFHYTCAPPPPRACRLAASSVHWLSCSVHSC